MKKIAFLFIIILISSNRLFGQKEISKAYAYSRKVIPGLKTPKATLGGNELKEEKINEKFEYFIFLQMKNDSIKIACKRIWIQSKCFSIKEVSLTKTPFIISSLTDGKNQKDTLVGKTKESVYNIFTGNLVEVKPTKRLKKSIQSNDILIELKINNRIIYYPIKKMKSLPDFLMM